MPGSRDRQTTRPQGSEDKADEPICGTARHEGAAGHVEALPEEPGVGGDPLFDRRWELVIGCKPAADAEDAGAGGNGKFPGERADGGQCVGTGWPAGEHQEGRLAVRRRGEEYRIARAWRDGRVQRIYGGTNEIMKEIIGRSLGL